MQRAMKRSSSGACKNALVMEKNWSSRKKSFIVTSGPQMHARTTWACKEIFQWQLVNVSEFTHSNCITLSYYSSPKHKESAS